MKKMYIIGLAVCIQLFSAATAWAEGSYESPSQTAAVTDEGSANLPIANFKALNSTFNWFLDNPPNADGSNFNTRWNKTAILDEYGWQLSNKTWNSYRSSWINNPSTADALEHSNPILYYLDRAEERTIKEIKRTKVEHGVVIWQLYNMGTIVKTKNTTFGLDIVSRDFAELADIVDFAIFSHKHQDHYDQNFVNALAAKGKPVYAPFSANGITVISDTSEYNFGEVNVRFTMNQQAATPVLVSQINLGPSADNYTIYDIADSRDLTALKPTRHINLFKLHIANGYDPIKASNQIKADVTLYSHEMELGHSTAANGYRWKYGYAYNKK